MFFLFLPLKKIIERNTFYLIQLFKNNANCKDLTILEFNTVAKDLITEQEKNVLLEQEKALLKAKENIANQLVHDIRSPLAALNMLLKNDLSVSSETNSFLKDIDLRIREICDDLIKSYRDSHKNISKVNIYDLLNKIIIEKKQRYSDRNVTLNFVSESERELLISSINSSDFKRTLSNLIDNAYEAVSDFGQICIILNCDSSNLFICIQDNGKGIPPLILRELGKR